MSRFKVLINNPTVPQITYTLLQEKCDIIVSPRCDKASLLKLIPGIDALFWCGRDALDKELLDAAGPQLKVVGAMASGFNHIDTAELKRKNIKLSNTPNVLNNAVADQAILLALGASRRLTEGRWHLENGTWHSTFDCQWMEGQDISDATVGIIGLGGIGQAIARRLKPFEISRILYTGHKEKPGAQALGAEFVSLDILTKESDFIFLAAPLTNETKEMCNSNFFRNMKNTGIFVNISRGGLVDHNALVAALKQGEIFAAGLDVMIPEPLNTDNELLKLPNVVLAPHTGGCTKKSRDKMATLAAQNILNGLAGKPLITPVNF